MKKKTSNPNVKPPIHPDLSPKKDSGGGAPGPHTIPHCPPPPKKN